MNLSPFLLPCLQLLLTFSNHSSNAFSPSSLSPPCWSSSLLQTNKSSGSRKSKNNTPSFLPCSSSSIDDSTTFPSEEDEQNSNDQQQSDTTIIAQTQSSSASSATSSATSASTSGDKIRESNNIRPSLNPTIINAISQALLERSTSKSQSQYIPSSTNQPINIMINAASLASKTIQSRAQSATSVAGDEHSIFNAEESKLVAGRIVGVLMRLHELENELVSRVGKATWVKKYGEEAIFGLCKVELKDDSYSPSDVLSIVDTDKTSNDSNTKDNNNEHVHQILERIKDDPLLRMCRAECIYALFLKTVEVPSMEKAGQVVPVGSSIDFLDQERIDVLFPSSEEE